MTINPTSNKQQAELLSLVHQINDLTINDCEIKENPLSKLVLAQVVNKSGQSDSVIKVTFGNLKESITSSQYIRLKSRFLDFVEPLQQIREECFLDWFSFNLSAVNFILKELSTHHETCPIEAAIVIRQPHYTLNQHTFNCLSERL